MREGALVLPDATMHMSAAEWNFLKGDVGYAVVHQARRTMICTLACLPSRNCSALRTEAFTGSR